MPALQVTIHEAAKAAYLVSGSTWVGFDLPQTLYMKIKEVERLGLGGLMVSASWRAGRPAVAGAVDPLPALPLALLQAQPLLTLQLHTLHDTSCPPAFLIPDDPLNLAVLFSCGLLAWMTVTTQ